MIFTKAIPTFFLILATLGFTHAQNKNIGIGTATPEASAIVHLGDDNGMGFKIPYTDTNAVIAYANSFTPAIPIANGLLIYQKGAETFFYYDAPKNKWIPLSGITGPTGIRGATGPTGLTGSTGNRSQMRWGNGFPTQQAGDTCGSYYVDVLNTYLYRFQCPTGWQFRGGPYKSRIKEGETVHLSSQTEQLAKELLPSDPNYPLEMDTINGLSYNVVVPFGYTGYAWVTAYGSAKKVNKNDDYTYARFDIFVPTIPSSLQKSWQVVAMGPNTSNSNNEEIVNWSISKALEISGSQTIQIRAGQEMRSKTGLGDIIIAGAPGSETQSHVDIMIYYVRD